MDSREGRREDGRQCFEKSQIHFHHPATLRINLQARSGTWLLPNCFDAIAVMDGERWFYAVDPQRVRNLPSFQLNGPDLVEVSVNLLDISLF